MNTKGNYEVPRRLLHDEIEINLVGMDTKVNQATPPPSPSSSSQEVPTEVTTNKAPSFAAL